MEAVRELFREYAGSLEEHKPYLVGFDEEVEALPAGYDFILVADGAGCVAVRRLDRGACEMKRLYVRPAARGTGAGRALALTAIEHARERGYAVMRLDTLPFMAEAGSLYRSLGFVEVDRYNDNPAPGVRFMELRL
ncbi:MAG TPA: GNAT family N-acetyltransferase [Gaiellaceae bacterium]|nr:GNAT family N-acetyltransferase [Gaiellaceae bacterium]